MKLTDKDAVAVEVERRIKETESMQPKFDQFWAGQISAFKGILKILNTLEVKEVDLDKEIRRYRMKNPIIQHREESLYDYMANAAKHFFELGLKAQKGE